MKPNDVNWIPSRFSQFKASLVFLLIAIVMLVTIPAPAKVRYVVGRNIYNAISNSLPRSKEE